MIMETRKIVIVKEIKDSLSCSLKDAIKLYNDSFHHPINLVRYKKN